MKKNQPQPYKMGDLILITKRKCSDKVQPRIKVGTHYLVLAESKIKSGAVVLKVAEFAKMAKEVLVRPKDNIDPKDIQRVNEERFEWKRCSKTKMQKEFLEFKESFEKEKESREMKFLEEKFTEKERIQMAYTPYLFAELTWHYAEKALEAAKEKKIDKYKKVARLVKAFRVDFNQELRKKMTQPVLECAQSRLQGALEDHSLDFFIFMTTVKNEINRQYVGLEHDDVKTFAYMAQLCYKSQRKLDQKNVEIIKKKLGGEVGNHETFKYMSDLQKCLETYMDGCKVEFTQPIQTAVKIMERNINNTKL